MSVQLQVSGVGKYFVSPRGDVTAIENISFTLSESEFVSIVGPSGCGKSTLLRLVAGLLTPDSGTIEFSGWSQSPRCRLVFQEHALFPWMTVVDNVAFGLEMDGVGSTARRERAMTQLATMGLADFAEHYPQELSGGMRQRAAIARALVTEPDILLMDEPFGALDAQTRLLLQELLLTLWQAQHIMVLYVTHDIEEAILLSDRVLVMSGRPGYIKEEIRVPLKRPRILAELEHTQLAQLRWDIWKKLESDIRQTQQ